MSHGLFEIHDEEIDVDEIMSRIQERVRTRPAAPPATSSRGEAGPSPVPWDRVAVSQEAERELAVLRANCDAASQLPERTRLRTLKRFMLWAMGPFTRAQTAFNSGVLWAASRQIDRTSALAEGVQALEAAQLQQHRELLARLAEVEARVGEALSVTESRAARLESQAESSESELATLAKRVEEAIAGAEDRATRLAGGFDEATAVARDRLGILEQRVEELRILEQRVEELRILEQRVEELRILEQRVEELRVLEQRLEELRVLDAREISLGRQQEALRQEVLLQKRRLELVLREVRQQVGTGPEAAARLREHEESLSDHIGFLHEQSFRGTDEELRERMQLYVPLLAAARERVGGEAPVLDIGPGRGTLLELLREAGIPNRGVDLNEDMVQVCQAKGLEVTRGDGLDSLASLPDQSLLGVTALHLVEHLSTAQLMEFVKLCHQKIRRGGLLALETPNPANVLTSAIDFNADLTHRRPIVANTLAHLVEALGFVDVRVEYLHPASPEMRLRLTSGASRDLEAENENWRRLNDFLFGPRDYAIIASR